jgi:outer membrane protein OmpA-like peptidoglycan-associated protein
MSAWKQLMEDIFGAKPEEAKKRRGNAKTLRSAEPLFGNARAHEAAADAPDTIREINPNPRNTGEYTAQAGSPGAPPESERGERPIGPALVVGGGIGALSLVVALLSMGASVVSAKERLLAPDEASKPNVAVAQQAEVGYCTKDFKTVLERVLHSCGLAEQTERRGCKPSDIKTFAAISDGDFNSLFLPLQQRGGVLMFDDGSDELDAQAKKILEERWYERKGARYFFVVARASKTGTPEKNRALSHRRANSVLFHLKEISGETEAELNQKVGLLWLGNEYAQLPEEYCSWPRSRSDARCDEEAINRSAFVSWVDCRL